MADIERASETARWVALYRATESGCPDTRFNDPYARRLAGSPMLLEWMRKRRALSAAVHDGAARARRKESRTFLLTDFRKHHFS